jgi:hypothetical protein
MTQNMSIKEIQTLVIEESNKIWLETKLNGLITHIVPFLPMNRMGTMEFVQWLLRQLPQHRFFKEQRIQLLEVTCDDMDQLVQFIYDEAQEPLYRDQNYRGVEKVFGFHVTGPLLNEVERYLHLHPEERLFKAHLTLNQRNRVIEVQLNTQ